VGGYCEYKAIGSAATHTATTRGYTCRNPRTVRPQQQPRISASMSDPGLDRLPPIAEARLVGRRGRILDLTVTGGKRCRM